MKLESIEHGKMKLESKSDVYRYSNKKYILKPETIADHVWYMHEIAFRLRRHLEFDLKEVIYKIAIHDWEESVTLDLPRDFKHYSPEYKSLTDQIAFELLERKGIMTEDIIEDAKNAKSHDTIEGAIVHFIDVYQAYLKLSDEVDLGNGFITKELDTECQPYLQEVVETISEKYPELDILYNLI